MYKWLRSVNDVDADTDTASPLNIRHAKHE